MPQVPLSVLVAGLVTALPSTSAAAAALAPRTRSTRKPDGSSWRKVGEGIPSYGDQFSDLTGGYADRAVELPNLTDDLP